MLAKVLRTDADGTLTFMRFVLGAVMFPHGAQKVLGWFGGFGYDATVAGFGQMGIPAALATVAIFAEFFGSIGLMLGLLGRLAALGIAVIMVVAVWLVHMPYGFFMDWMGKQGGQGFEYHLLALGLALPLIVRGSGAFSIDRYLAKWLDSRRANVAHGLHDAHAH